MIEIFKDKHLPAKSSNKKHQLVDCLRNRYKIPLQTPTPGKTQSDKPPNRPFELLEEEVNISKGSVEEMTKAEFKTVDLLMRICDPENFPQNLVVYNPTQ